ncbi:MAG: metal ABC transporter ATP-binding protein [Spirochaetaceae bacterium]|jgi:zinc transport system ATP-binding protein|nr:metal ABC transporter ATP-binding protein [Spirochaetaceae bacterium]
MAVLRCTNAAFAYDGAVVLGGVTITIESGELVCVLGENGSGKSTFVKGLVGSIKPVSGKIEIEGRTQAAGYLPQQTARQKDFPASAEEIVLSGRITGGFKPFYTPRDRQIARETMRKLRIEALRGVCFRELSGGQQKRVLLARALCAARRLLVLDEPASGLDPLVTAEVYALLQALNADGLTIVMVTHDVPYALSRATKIIHVHHGAVWSGSVDDYKTSREGAAFLRGGGEA